MQVEEERKRRETREEEADMDQNHMVRRNSIISKVYVNIDLPNLDIWLINKISGLHVFYRGLLGLKL